LPHPVVVVVVKEEEEKEGKDKWQKRTGSSCKADEVSCSSGVQ
jgi:hypothetical protein